MLLNFVVVRKKKIEQEKKPLLKLWCGGGGFFWCKAGAGDITVSTVGGWNGSHANEERAERQNRKAGT